MATALTLSACATDVKLDQSNGGELVKASALRTGDIILSATNGINSAGIRAITFSPVSHSVLYVGQCQQRFFGNVAGRALQCGIRAGPGVG